MSIFAIADYCGIVKEYVSADNERQALCMYLMNHEEMIDSMLWKAPSGLWKLARYDEDDFFLFARKVKG